MKLLHVVLAWAVIGTSINAAIIRVPEEDIEDAGSEKTSASL